MSFRQTYVNQELDYRTEFAIIKEAKELYNLDTLVLWFSGGKDSQVTGKVVEQIARQLGLKFRVLHSFTGIGVKENFEFILQTCNKYGWQLDIETPEPRFSYEAFVKRYGFPGEQAHDGMMRWIKWFSLRRFNRKLVDQGIRAGFVSGTRKKESKRRKKNMKMRGPVQKAINENKQYPIYMIAPLYYWSTKQVWDYIRSNSLEICPVYETLHLSGDCLCGCFAESDESRLLKIFHKETADQIHALEIKYGGKWGTGRCVSMGEAMKESTISDFVCQECIYEKR